MPFIQQHSGRGHILSLVVGIEAEDAVRNKYRRAGGQREVAGGEIVIMHTPSRWRSSMWTSLWKLFWALSSATSHGLFWVTSVKAFCWHEHHFRPLETCSRHPHLSYWEISPSKHKFVANLFCWTSLGDEGDAFSLNLEHRGCVMHPDTTGLFIHVTWYTTL